MPRSGLLTAMLAVHAAVVGCTASEGSAPVTVVLMSGSQLADAPSAYIVRIASASSGDEVRATATNAVTVDEDDGLVLLEDALPPGQYRLAAAQQGCGMHGNDCPDDPSSSAFVGTTEWQCSVAFEATTSRRTRVEIVEGPHRDVADQKVCRVIA